MMRCAASRRTAGAAHFVEQGHDVHMIRVAGGEHEGNFWSEPVTAAIIDFIETHA
ncbi:hypothetical protein [Bifidobacterium callitrichidarum]|uniref:hypothetical protein n=1 Tax=Bifidobacterium callitrichidarum TaxID=2052941 RepID=UPI001304CC47|nr:hypothetical protein [Bifidobacterium callitrichidarum]